MKVGREAVPWASTKHQDPQLKGLNLRKRLQEKILVTISLSRFDAVFQCTQSPCC
jgi:hypothetical protein